MTSTADHRHHEMRRQVCRYEGRDIRHRPTSRPVRAAIVTAAMVGLIGLMAGCGGTKSPGANGNGGSTSGPLAQFEAYSRCMRGHGIPDFPDPTANPGGGISIQINGDPGSDLNRNNPKFKAANQTCQSLEPRGGSEPFAVPAQKIAAEVKWAQCMRSHGLSSFPDPDSQGAFDSSKFNESTPAFQSASNACQSLMNDLGPIPVHPGHR